MIYTLFSTYVISLAFYHTIKRKTDLIDGKRLLILLLPPISVTVLAHYIGFEKLDIWLVNTLCLLVLGFYILREHVKDNRKSFLRKNLMITIFSLVGAHLLFYTLSYTYLIPLIEQEDIRHQIDIEAVAIVTHSVVPTSDAIFEALISVSSAIWGGGLAFSIFFHSRRIKVK